MVLKTGASREAQQGYDKTLKSSFKQICRLKIIANMLLTGEIPKNNHITNQQWSEKWQTFSHFVIKQGDKLLAYKLTPPKEVTLQLKKLIKYTSMLKS